MTQWGLDTLFNPAKRHMDEEKRRLQSTREEVGDSSGGRRVDFKAGTIRISRPAATEPAADETPEATSPAEEDDPAAEDSEEEDGSVVADLAAEDGSASEEDPAAAEQAASSDRQ
jgi:hypothetical protein